MSVHGSPSGGVVAAGTESFEGWVGGSGRTGKAEISRWSKPRPSREVSRELERSRASVVPSSNSRRGRYDPEKEARISRESLSDLEEQYVCEITGVEPIALRTDPNQAICGRKAREKVRSLAAERGEDQLSRLFRVTHMSS